MGRAHPTFLMLIQTTGFAAGNPPAPRLWLYGGSPRGRAVPEPLSRSLEDARAADTAGDREAAEAGYRAHLDQHPWDLDAWVELGGLLLVLGRFDEAAAASATVLRQDPRHYGALLHAASARMHRGDLDGAEAAFQEALALDPERLSGRLMLADCLLRRRCLDRARGVLEGILEQSPDHPVALERLSLLLVYSEDWPTLRRHMQRQVERYSGAEAEYVASHIDLLFGDMARGWPRFEARLRIPGRHPDRPRHPQPFWQGEPFPDRTLLLTWEQGLGDSLMFLRFAAAARARGGRVVLEIQPALAELAATCAGLDEVVPAGAPLPAFDLQASLLSLPALLGTRLDSVPAAVPYLSVPADVPERLAISRLLEASAGRVRVGLCWAGNPDHPQDGRRSLPAATLEAFAVLPHIAWHSFQFGSDELPPLPAVTRLGPLLKGFPNTAFALTAMDLVVTVDTVLAHLAGALGIPTFLLASFIPDWRWMLGRCDSPWYPTLRIYRQQAPGDWGSALAQVVGDLSGFQAEAGP